MKKRIRNHVGIAIVSFLVLAYFPPDGRAKDPDYPTKPITFYITMGAGGTTDIAARSFIQVAAKHLGQPFVPVNKPGAGGSHAAMAIMTAKPDGYTMGVASPSTVFLGPFADNAPYKDLSGFTFIVNYGNFVYPLLVQNNAAWKTWQEFIEWARKNPKAAKIAITGARSVGTQGNIFWQIEKREQVEFTYVPFKSSAEVLNAILGGHITIYASTVDASTIPYLKEGKLRVIAYLGKDKVKGYENVPSTYELYGFSIPNLMGVWGPKSIPNYVLKKLDEGFAKAVKEPDFIHVMNRMYTPVVYMNRDQMNKYVEETRPKVAEIIKALKAEEAKARK